MNPKHDTAAAARLRHEAPVDADDMTLPTGVETSETEAIEEDGEPLGGNFA